MDKLLVQLKRDFPSITFREGTHFRWSPATQEVTYKLGKEERYIWTLLHELGHALLAHNTYDSDFALLRLEVAAWAKAQELQGKYRQKIDPEHIQNCLDTYRDWLHRRSTCPVCGNRSLQSNPTTYQCFNCHASWSVTAARFCRPYRRMFAPVNEKSPDHTAPAIFA